MEQKRALRQFNELKKYLGTMRLAAEEWPEPWQALIAILMSARTRDEVTIVVAENLFDKYPRIEMLASAKVSDVEKVIRPVNFYHVKARKVIGCCKMLIDEHKGNPPLDIDQLVELPGVGRKTANVFLAEMGKDGLGIDTHVSYVSQYLGWTQNAAQYKIEEDLKALFPQSYWRHVNGVLVRFGKKHTSRKKKNELLDRIKKIR